MILVIILQKIHTVYAIQCTVILGLGYERRKMLVKETTINAHQTNLKFGLVVDISSAL